MRVPRFLCLLLAAALAACGNEPQDPTPTMDVEKLDEYRARILPTDAEVRWSTIDWLPTYTDGLKASSAQDKPLLLWVMNGHPLGCT